MIGGILNFVYKAFSTIWDIICEMCSDFYRTIVESLMIDEAMGESRSSQVIGFILLVAFIIFCVVKVQ